MLSVLVVGDRCLVKIIEFCAHVETSSRGGLRQRTELADESGVSPSSTVVTRGSSRPGSVIGVGLRGVERLRFLTSDESGSRGGAEFGEQGQR